MTPRGGLITSAVIGGAGGSLAMDIAQFVWAQALERNRSPDDHDEETEAITAVVGYLTRFAPRIFREADAQVIGHTIHYLFGIGFAGAYLYLLPNRQPNMTRGAVFGTLLWLLSDRILIPVFKLGRPWSRYSMTERSNALVSHLAYALVVEYSRPRA